MSIKDQTMLLKELPRLFSDIKKIDAAKRLIDVKVDSEDFVVGMKLDGSYNHCPIELPKKIVVMLLESYEKELLHEVEKNLDEWKNLEEKKPE